MFWRMTGLSTTSPIDAILDKDNYTLEELLDEDEIIQECKALNSRLINFLREKTQVEQLVRYIVEESPEDVEKSRTFKYPFIACEIFTCEVDVILKALIEEEELMDILFAFLQPERSHSTLLSGYFSKVVICLMLRKTLPFMTYVQAHKEIIHQLVDLIGITSIMEVLVRLVGADDHIYTNYIDTMQWLNDSDVLEMIVDKFSSSESPEVHANTAETFCAILRYTPSTLASKIASPSFVGRLFSHALDGSRPKSVLVHSLTVCIALLDPKRAFSTPAYLSRGQLSYGSSTIASTETVEGMLEKLGDLLQLLDVSSSELTWVTTYGKLQPPLGKHRLKIVEFISVLLSTGAEVAEKELVRLGAFKQILNLFFEYPFNNFLHHHVEDMILSCLEFRKNALTEHLFQDCDLVGRILAAERSPTLSPDSEKPTSASGRLPPKIGNIGHLTRIENKLVQLANSNSQILTYLQENSDWTSWQTDVLTKRNALENVYNWTCGRPTTLHERTRDSDDDDFRDRDYDVAALASNLSQAFRYGIYGNDDIEEAHGSLERDDEQDVYFDDESAEVVISSLRLGDEQESGSIFTNSNWFTFGDDRDGSNNLASVSPSAEDYDAALVAKDSESQDTSRSPLEPEESGLQSAEVSNDTIREEVNDHQLVDSAEGEKPPEWVEWRESSDSGTPEANSEAQDNNAEPDQEPLMSGVGAPPLHPDSPAVEETGGKSMDPSLLVFEDVDLSSEEGPSGAINHDAHEGVEGGDAKDVVDDVAATAAN